MVAHEGQNPEGINRGESRCDKTLADSVPVCRTVTLRSDVALWTNRQRRLGRDIAERPRPLQLRPLVGSFWLWLRNFSSLIFRLQAKVPSPKNRSRHNREVISIGCSRWTEGLAVKGFLER